MAITKAKVTVYQLMADVIVKFLLGLAVCGAFIAIVVKILADPSWPVATFGTFLSATVFAVFQHYFHFPVTES